MSKAFKFPLEALRKHREHKLTLAKKEFMLVENKIVDLMNKKKSMVEEKSSLMSEDIFQKKMPFAGQAMLLEMTQTRIRQVELSITEQEGELEKHRRWVAELNREMKALEKLEEKMRHRWSLEQKRKEQKQGDAWVAIQWARQNGEGGSA